MMNDNDIYNSVDLGEDFLAHYGVPGMHWGIRKDPDKYSTRRGADGVRPLARTLDQSRFGKLANANANRYMRKQNTRALAKGKPFPKKSTSNNPDRKTINRNAAIDAARAAGFNPPQKPFSPLGTAAIVTLGAYAAPSIAAAAGLSFGTVGGLALMGLGAGATVSMIKSHGRFPVRNLHN